jgi:nucleoid-associated protein YgaU
VDDRTETFDPQQPESYEWDYEEAGDRPPRVLWGRVVALIVFLALAFWLGRSSASESGAELERVQGQLEDARAEIDDLEQQLSAAAENPSPEPTAESTPVATGEEQTYVVKQGDTLRGIAIRFYGDPALASLIMEANGIDDAQSLSVGAELTIPPEPEG